MNQILYIGNDEKRILLTKSKFLNILSQKEENLIIARNEPNSLKKLTKSYANIIFETNLNFSNKFFDELKNKYLNNKE